MGQETPDLSLSIPQAPPEDFIPAHKYFDKKVLRFYGYFKETVHESPQEHFRVRPVEVR